MKANRVFLACLVFTSVVHGQPTNCVSPPTSLVSWWRAETNTFDSWGENHGSATAKFQMGKVGMGFTAASSTVVSNSASLQITNELTIEAWVTTTNIFQAYRTVVSKFDFPQFTTSQQGSYFLGTTFVGNYPNTPVFMLSPSGSLSGAVAVTPVFSNLPAGQWSHLAGTYDGSAMRLYLNGRLIAQSNYNRGIFPGNASLGIGAAPLSSRTFHPFNGLIDEVSIYRRALSAAEIGAIYAADSRGKCPVSSLGCVAPLSGLVSWWRAESDKGEAVNLVLDNWDSNNGASVVPMQYSTGKVGRAFNLLQNYVRVPDSLSLRFTNAFAIEAWIKPSTVALASQSIVSKFELVSFSGPSGSGSSYYFGITNGGYLVFRVSTNGSPATNTSLLSTQRIVTTQWTHVAATLGAGTMRLFINGQEDTKRPHAGGVFPGGANLGIGALLGAANEATYRFTGLMDEVSIYNRELSEFEVQAIYRADASGKCLVPPSIVDQPQSQAISRGEDVKFVASIFGSRPFRYQWRFNGQNLASATNAALILEKVQSNRIGNYSVFVSNSVGTVLSSSAALTLLPAPDCTQTPPGLISWWPGDGNGADTMGTNNIAAFSPTLYVTGKLNRAFSFNGVSSRVQVNSSPSLNFNTNADFSIEMWIKAGASNSTYARVPLLEKLGSFLDLPRLESSAGYSLSLNQGRLAFSLGSLKGLTAVASNYISPGPDLRDTMFHHVAVSVNRKATNGGNLYVDGQLVLTFDPTPQNGNLTTQSPLFIGAPAYSGLGLPQSSYFGGLIDEPAIYGRALSTAEILTIRNAGAAGRCKVRPFIVTQPASQRVTVGSNATFSVVADGTPTLRYQWMRNNAAIAGATNTSLTFTATNFSATYSVRVTNLFGSVLSSNAVVTINNAPIALNLSLQVDEDTGRTISLPGSDADKDPLKFLIVTPPLHGVLGPITNFPAGGTLTYMPALNYHGPDSFNFRVNDGLADSGLATVSLDVLPVNDAPVALSQAVFLDEDMPTTIVLGAVDVDGDALTYNVGAPAHGTLSGVAPSLVYQSTTNYFGPDGFTFSVSDGRTNSNVATVSLTVRPVNDAPSARISVSPLVTNAPGTTNWVILAAVCDDATVVLDGSASTDVENDPLSYTWLNETNVIATGMVVTNLLALGSHELGLQVNDGQATGTATAVVEIITPAQGVGIVIVLLTESDLGRRSIQPLVASLNNAAAAFDRCEAKPGANQLEAFQHKVRAQIAPLNPELAAKLLEAVEQVLQAVR